MRIAITHEENKIEVEDESYEAVKDALGVFFQRLYWMKIIVASPNSFKDLIKELRPGYLEEPKP